MTVKVIVENHDAVRRIEVIEVFFDKDHGMAQKEGVPHLIEPGGNSVHHVHPLMDLRVREAHADLQQRPKL